jgi:hypothetical protein
LPLRVEPTMHRSTDQQFRDRPRPDPRFGFSIQSSLMDVPLLL